jgi:RNA-directed DNA polymerase
LRPPILSPQIRQIAAQAVDKTRAFTNLAHLIDVELLQEAFSLTRKDGAPGIDGVTGDEYAKDLRSNLEDLHDRLRTGRYRATPVRRVWIKKEDGGERPLGITLLRGQSRPKSRGNAAHTDLRAGLLFFFIWIPSR